jgi:hypothetical protein
MGNKYRIGDKVKIKNSGLIGKINKIVGNQYLVKGYNKAHYGKIIFEQYYHEIDLEALK